MRGPPPPLDAINEVYLDESSQTKHRFLVMGGIIVHGPQSPAIEDAILAARLPELPRGEMAWTKVSRTKLQAYGRVVELFFDNPGGFMPFEFHSLVVDMTRIDDRKHNEGSRDTGFNKEIYQLCQKFA